MGDYTELKGPIEYVRKHRDQLGAALKFQRTISSLFQDFNYFDITEAN